MTLPDIKSIYGAKMGLFGNNRIEEGLVSREELLRLFLRASDEKPDFLWCVNKSRQIIYYDKAFKSTLAPSAENIKGDPFLKVLVGNKNWASGRFHSSVHELADRLKHKQPVSNLIVEAQGKWLEISALPRFTDKGEFIGFYGVGSDVTEVRERSEVTAFAANFDPLTSLPNFDFFIKQVESRMAEVGSPGRKFCLGVVAVTNFHDLKFKHSYRDAELELDRVGAKLRNTPIENCILGAATPGEFLFFSEQTENAERLREDVLDAIKSSMEWGYCQASSLCKNDIQQHQNLKHLIYAMLDELYTDNIANSRLISEQNEIRQDHPENVSSDSVLNAIKYGEPIRAGLRQLIEDHEKRNHNKPDEMIDNSTLSSLLELDRQIDELLSNASEGKNVDEEIDLVRALTNRVFQYSMETGELFVAGLKPLIASLPTAWGTMTLLQTICSPATFGLVGPGAALAVVAGHYGLNLKKK